MSKAPQKIADAVPALCAALAKGATSLASAEAKLAELIGQDPAYARGVLRIHAARLLAAYRKANPETPDPLQAELFPALPARLYVAVGRPEKVMNLTRYGLEMARNMLYARTSNQAEGAARAAAQERASFDALYAAVSPYMIAGDSTVADALARRAAAGEAA